MYKVDIEKKDLIELEQASFSKMGLKERFDIQEWIEKTPAILGEELLVIGKEVELPSGKRLDLLCLDKEAKLVIVELKRDESGSTADWQAIKYASYCSNYSVDEIFQRYAKYLSISNDEAREKIEDYIDCEIKDLNKEQRIILVSKEFNPEVISAVLWLMDFGVSMQCTRLTPYHSDGTLFIKPETIIPLPEAKDYIERKVKKQRSISANFTEWTGYWFVNVGEGVNRTWDDNVRYGFLGAGQGRKYSDALKKLRVGDKLYAYMAGLGYVGYGEVTHTAQMIRDYLIDGKKLIDMPLKAERPRDNIGDDELSEWVVGVRWIHTYEKDKARTFNDRFANPNIVCKLRHEQTLQYLEKEFQTNME